MGCSPPGSSVHGISQARVLEWVAIPSSRGSSGHRDRTWVSGMAGGLFTVWAITYLYIEKVCLVWQWEPIIGTPSVIFTTTMMLITRTVRSKWLQKHSVSQTLWQALNTHYRIKFSLNLQVRHYFSPVLLIKGWQRLSDFFYPKSQNQCFSDQGNLTSKTYKIANPV